MTKSALYCFSSIPQAAASVYFYDFNKNKNDGLKLYNSYITTALKCVPPGDKPTFAELETCFKYFK